MSNLLTLNVPGEGGPVVIQAPEGIPTGGLSGAGGQIISNSITILLIVAILLALGFLIFGGISWISSGGDKAKLESARKTIIFAIIGMLISIFSIFIMTFISSALGVNLLDISL